MNNMKMTTDDLYTLYNDDPDFKRYVDEWARNHNLSKDEIFTFVILREYVKYLKEGRK